MTDTKCEPGAFEGICQYHGIPVEQCWQEKPKSRRFGAPISHTELVTLAGLWLAKSCKIAVTEVQTYSTELPDCFGWQNGQVHWLDDKYVHKEPGFIFTTLVEVKVSRSDFLADFKKPHRQIQRDGMGNYRYYCCPNGMIKPEELPENWGLLYERNGKIKSIKTAKFIESNKSAELWLLYNAAYKGSKL